MTYDVNDIDCEEKYTAIKNKIKRIDSVTYICKKCGTLVNKGARCYNNFNNLCRHCSIIITVANRPVEITKAIVEKVQAKRRMHLDEINAKISYKLKHRSSEAIKNTVEKRKQTMLKLYGGTTTLTSSLKQNVQQTNMQKYGGISPMCSAEIIDKQKENYIKNNGGMGFASNKVKETFKKNYKEKYGVEFSSQNPIVRKKQAARYKYDNLSFDSIPEIAYYIWLKDHNVNFEYQPNTKFKYFYENIMHYYFPDFKVDGIYVEIKGLHFFKNGNINETMINPFDRSQDGVYEAKHQCMIKNNVKIITEFDEYIKYVKNKYGKSYLNSLKKV